MSIAGILRRWVLVSAVTGVLALIQVPGVRAQAVQPVQMPPSPIPNQPVQMPPNPNPNQPVPTAPSPGPLNPRPMEPQPERRNVPGWRQARRDGAGRCPDGAGTVPGTAPLIGARQQRPERRLPDRRKPPCRSPTGLSALDVIHKSLFDDIYSTDDSGLVVAYHARRVLQPRDGTCPTCTRRPAMAAWRAQAARLVKGGSRRLR